MSEAVEALAAMPAVQRYNTSLEDPSQELHVQAITLQVLWPLQAPSPATHADVIPDLLRWTATDHAEDWGRLRRYDRASHVCATRGSGFDGGGRRPAVTHGAAASPASGLHPRLRGQPGGDHGQAFVLRNSCLEVGRRSNEQALALCRQTAQQLAAGRVEAVVDDTTGRVVDIRSTRVVAAADEA